MIQLKKYKISPNVIRHEEFAPVNYVENYCRSILGSSAKDVVKNVAINAIFCPKVFLI